MCRFLNIKRLKICKVLDYISEYCKCHKLLSYWSAGVFLSCIFHFPNVWNPFSVMWQNCPIWYVCQQWMIFMSSQREYKRQERKYTPVYRRCRHTQGWWPFSTNFFCISKKEKSGVLFRLWWLFADSPFGFLVLQIFPVERRENFHSSWCNTVQQPVAVVQESICAPKGFFVWLLVYSLCRCREYGPLVRSFGCRCKLKLPVWCLAESWIWCVHQSHHHSPGQLLQQGGFKESVKLLMLWVVWGFKNHLGHIWKQTPRCRQQLVS